MFHSVRRNRHRAAARGPRPIPRFRTRRSTRTIDGQLLGAAEGDIT